MNICLLQSLFIQDCFVFSSFFKISMNVLKSKTSVDLIPTVPTQFHIITAVVNMDSSLPLVWKYFIVMTMLHAEVTLKKLFPVQ